jgi:Reverse transcriptase (RNA-dependent DNA polymerase)/gag-polypeptide of LTR copia-type/GAG-pre-integrase domain
METDLNTNFISNSSTCSVSNGNQETPLVMLSLPISTKLERENYLSWQSQIVPLLHAYGLFRFLETDSSPSPTILTTTGVSQINPAYLPWYKQDQMILGWLRSSLSREILAQVVSAKTSADLWQTLQRSFSATSRARLSELRRKLQNTSKGSSTCLEYIQKIQSVANELTFIGEPVSDDDLQMYILQGLGPEFDPFVVAVQTSASRSIADLISLLYSHESLLLSRTQARHTGVDSLLSAQNPIAMYNTKSGAKLGKTGYRQRGGFSRQQHFSSFQNLNAPLLPKPTSGPRPSLGYRLPRFNPDKDVICQICYKKGHQARNCWYRSDLTNYPEVSSTTIQAHLAQPTIQANSAQPDSISSGPDWYLDSGATHHVTNDINNLSSYMPYDGMDSLKIGNGLGMRISHIGSCKLTLANYALVLSDVLYVPSFTKNLLSLSKLLHDNPILIEFHENCCVIKERLTLMPLLQIMLHEGLYIISLHISPNAFFGARVSANLWHSRLGHPSSSTTLQVLRSHDLPCHSNKLSLCHNCCLAKAHRLPFSSSVISTSSPLELVHSDVWGPAPLISHNGFRYYVLFIDDYTCFTWIYFMKSKDELMHVFSLFKSQIENLLNASIKILRSDGGTEYKPIARLFPSIVHQTTCPYIPQQNGVSERKHRHIIELALANMIHASIPERFWDDVFASVVYLINRLPPSCDTSSPFLKLFKKSPDYLFLRVLGCLCFPYIRPYNDHKLQARSKPCVFLGYSSQKGYKCLHIDSNKLFVSRHVVFDETQFPFKQQSHGVSLADHTPPSPLSWLPLLPPESVVSNSSNLPVDGQLQITNSAPAAAEDRQTSAPILVGSIPISGPSQHAPDPILTYSRKQKHHASAPSTPIEDPAPFHTYSRRKNNKPPISLAVPNSVLSTLPTLVPQITPGAQTVAKTSQQAIRSIHPMLTRSQTRNQLALLTESYVDTEPTTYNQAKNHSHWVDAMNKEHAALLTNQTWELVPPSPEQNVVGCKWVFKIKRRADGSLERYKARLVAKGFHQEEGVDFFDTFSPVIRPTTIRLVLSIALSFGWDIKQLDVQNVFLHGDLQETVYMQQPSGFIALDKPDHVCRLSKAIYDLKQSPRAWFNVLSKALIAQGFQASRYDPSLFVLSSHGNTIIVLIYVDDIILTGSNLALIQTLVASLQ